MPIVYCELNLFLPYCHSLKEKRQILRKVQDRLRSRFNFSIAEMDHQDLWQRAQLGAVTIGADGKVLERLARQFIAEAEEVLGELLCGSHIEFID
jgi:uncharacterized protein YlxP (DUF503 family)